ncbi:helix-turn-helix transcriptional regulator [Nonomuraea sp. SBT364]|uniref:helix-turn-helix transcriptional regulator n=1 Tax=Nonomuraea sp. SBT364 TaxID=1580530 RepID=UPI00066DFFD7|nr:HTH domain-containing protein [Nonomuraea sp. SBT364]
MLISPHPVVPRVERQHRLIEELRATAPRPLTAGSLAGRTGVSVRTVERDLAALQDAGLPIAARRGSGGGYAIDARRELPPLALTPGEASALVASLVAVGPRASASAQSALAKLITALCEGGDHARDQGRGTA